MEGGSKGPEEMAVGIGDTPFSLDLTDSESDIPQKRRRLEEDSQQKKNDGFSIIQSVTLYRAELSDQAMDTTEALKSAPTPPHVRPKTAAAQDNTVPPGATPCMKEIKAYPIDSNVINADILETYFESRSKANGDPVAKVELHGDCAIVQFENEEDARRVLTRPKHAIGKFEICVQPYVKADPSNNTAPSDDTRSRILVVMGTKNIEKEFLEVWFETPKNGGGPVEKIDFDEQNGIAKVIFETTELVTNFIKQKTAVIRGVTVTFLEPTEPEEEEEDDEPSRSIIVLGLGEELDEETLAMYFANEKRTGGGDIEAIEIDAAQDRAVIRYKDPEVAKRVLEKEELTIMKKTIKISSEIKWKWDGRTLEVHGVPAEYDRETLQLILENKKGGGPVLDIRMDSACAVATFVNKLDAKRLLGQGEITIGKHSLKFQQPCAPVDEQATTKGQRAETEASTDITVLGITKGMNVEVLQMLFENEKQSGGGPIEEIKVDEEWGTAVITYQTSAVAERVASRSKLTLMGKELTVDLRANMKKSFHAASQSGQENRDKEQNLVLEVTNVSEGTGDQMLQLMFESSRHGGGPVKEVILNAQTGTATISFEKQESVESVMTTYRGNKSMFKIKEAQLMLSVVDESNTVQVKNSCAIQVKDIPVNCTYEDIELYFENRRMCGGGPVEEVYNLKDSCVITFMEPEVASRVYQSHCSVRLKMENITLNVELMTNSHRLKTFGDEAIIQPNTLFVEDLPDDTTRDSLILYLEKVPDSKISDIWFGIHAGMALVMFSKMPEWLRFFIHCCLRPFRGRMLGISCVEKTKSIEVYNIGNCTKQNLEMYFEHKRSGGGEIEHTDVDANKNNAIVTFKKYGVADAVVAKKKHSLKNNELLITLHYPCLGILPVDHDKSTPKSSIPDDIVCDHVDKDIVLFLSQGRSKDFIDEQLATVHTKIDWSDSASSVLDSVTLKCTLPVAKASKDQTEEWSNKAKNAFWDTYKLYCKETVNVLQDGWTEFNTQILPLVPSTDTLSVLTDADSCTVVIVGKSTDVPGMFRQISKVKYAVEDAISRKKESITEEIKNLPVFKLRFTQTSRFLQEIKPMFPNAKVDLDMKSGKIIMRGLPNEVQTIKLRILEMLNEIQSETINLSPGVCDLLKQKKTRDHVVKKFKTQQIFMLFEAINRGQVMCCSRKADDLTNGKAILKAAVQEMVINIPDENVPTLGRNEWHDFMNQLMAANDGELILEVDSAKGSITIVCVDDISAGVREDIHRFLNENTILQQMIKMDIGAVRYLGEYKKDTLDRISTQFKVDIEILKHYEKHGLMLHGTKQCLQQCVKQVMTLAENIVQCRHGIDKPGMPKYFISPKGKDYLESLEMKHKAAILIDDKDTAVSSVADILTTVSTVSFKEPRVKSSYIIPNGPKVLVVEGDLTDYKVDVIVNAANEELAHVGGIAKAIVDKGGQSIQEECNKFVASRGRLSPGQIFDSEAGHLPCKRIIHAVGPRWQGGYRNEENYLYEAVYKSLEAVHRIKQRTVGIPAISTGVFGFPMDAACRNILDAIMDFCEEEPSIIREVHLVDPNTKVVDAFHEEMCKKFGKDNLQMSSSGAAQSVAPDTRSHLQAAAAAPSYWTKISSHALKSNEGITVTTAEGQIAEEKAEVIVNTTSKDFNLASGIVSASIVKAAGPSIQIECQKYIQSHGAIIQGDIVETSGGKIRTCKNIYHSSLQSWNDIGDDSVIRKFVQECLRRAHSNGMTSIAMPAVGTGNLHYPRDVVASAMYDEVRHFSQSYPSTKLRDIRFVVFDQPTVASFAAEKSKLEQNLGPRLPGAAATGSKRKLAKQTSKFNHSKRKRVLPSRSSGDTSGLQLLIQGRVRVQVLQGDITNVRCGAIVNGTNKQLAMGSYVGRAILQKGGTAIEDDMKRNGSKMSDGVLLTTAGALPCNAIIHMAVPDGMSRPSWEKRIKAVLKLASQHNLSSVAFPALGTGVQSIDPASMADIMLQSILDFCRKSSSSVDLIKIVIQKHMVDIYEQQLQACANSRKGVLQRLQGTSVDEFEVFEPTATKAFAHSRRLNFLIYADSQSTITQITKRIEATCDSESKEQVIDSERDQETIKNLTNEQIEQIQNFEATHGVIIKVEKIGRIKRIVVSGRMENTLEVVTQINKLFREIEDSQKFEEHAEDLHKHVQWMFDEGNGLEPYPPPISAIIEKAFQKNEPRVEFTEETKTNELRTCRINFSENKEVRNGDPKQTYSVKRSSKESYELLKHWDPMGKEVYKAVQLPSSSAEYKEVEQKFKTSISSGGSAVNSIISITRIQNPNLYQRYCVHLEHMEKCNPPQIKNELELWHGTADGALDEIHATGFNRGFSGKNGTAYGKGVYFAVSASLSNGYASPNASGHRHMYLSKVLVGETTRGNSALIVPPAKNPAQPAIKYDSVVDNETAPNLYVIFFDTQAYPEYLIKYT